MIHKILVQLGFGEKEIAVYLAVLEQGKATPASISKLTHIKRPTVYSIAKELVDKGVIVEDLGSKQSYLVALPPEQLKNLLRKEERQLEDRKVLVAQAIEELESVTKNTRYSIPKIHFVYEEDIENYLYKQCPVWSESVMKSGGTWWGFQDPSFVKHYQKWIDWSWEEGMDKNITLKLLTNRSPAERSMAKRKYERRLIKLWDKGSKFSATTWTNGDYLVMIVTNQHPFYLAEIHDAVLAHNMREMFRDIWDGLE